MSRPQAVATTTISFEAYTWDGLHEVFDEAMWQFGPTLTGFHWAVPRDIRWRLGQLIVGHLSAYDQSRMFSMRWNDRLLGLPIVETTEGGPVELRWVASRVALEPRRTE